MKHILVIDDDVQMRTLLQTILQRAGHTVSGAANGKEGLDQVRQQPPDLVISDLMMPDKDGLEVIREIRRLFPKVKVFAISGGSQLTHIDFLPIAKKLGALEIFAKPLDRALFLAKVREHLDTPSEPPDQTKTA